jgi:hypothetical protein
MRANLTGIFYYGSGDYFATGYSAFGSFVKDTIPGFLGTNRLNSGTTTIFIPAKYLDRWSGATQIAPWQLIPRDAFHGLPLFRNALAEFTGFLRAESVSICLPPGILAISFSAAASRCGGR